MLDQNVMIEGQFQKRWKSVAFHLIWEPEPLGWCTEETYCFFPSKNSPAGRTSCLPLLPPNSLPLLLCYLHFFSSHLALVAIVWSFSKLWRTIYNLEMIFLWVTLSQTFWKMPIIPEFTPASPVMNVLYTEPLICKYLNRSWSFYPYLSSSSWKPKGWFILLQHLHFRATQSPLWHCTVALWQVTDTSPIF